MLGPQAGAGEVLSKSAQNEGFETTKPPNPLGTIAFLKSRRFEPSANAFNPSRREVSGWFMKKSG
jgi:hypothetical protein